MAQVAYADESGTDDRSKCYGIGVITIPVEIEQRFIAKLLQLKNKHGVEGELKWTRIRKNHGSINFMLDVLAEIIYCKNITYDAIIVHKDMYRNWQGNDSQRETAFYKTYTQLLKHIARRSRDTAKVFIDQRSSSYSKHHEVIQTIGNRMLAKLHSHGYLQSVTPVDSHEIIGIQATDLLTGAITTSCCRYLQPSLNIHPGKKLAISRLSQMLGWDDLCCDTYPHDKFNIWHFPIEYRGIPGKVEPWPTGVIPYVSSADLELLH